ncbi:MAG: hypothetical protein IKK15_01260 [Akkermansia sp.]|nr:hypothetical protein [Akkermansia sp.]
MAKHTFEATIDTFNWRQDENHVPQITEHRTITVTRTSSHDYHFYWEILQVSYWYRLNEKKEWVPVPELTTPHHDCGFRTMPGPGTVGNVTTRTGYLQHGSRHYYKRETVTLFAKNTPCKIVK